MKKLALLIVLGLAAVASAAPERITKSNETSARQEYRDLKAMPQYTLLTNTAAEVTNVTSFATTRQYLLDLTKLVKQQNRILRALIRETE